jgi:hypothetical protein
MAITSSNNVNSQVGKQLKASTHYTVYNGAEQRKMKVQGITEILSELPRNENFHSGRRDIVTTSCLRRVRCHK